MTIRTKLRISVLLITAMTALIAMTGIYAAKHLLTENRKALLIEEIEHDVSGLNNVLHEYLLYHSERALAQCQTKYQRLAGRLQETEFSHPDENNFFKIIRHNHEQLGPVLAELATDYGIWQELAAPGKAILQARENRLAGQILVKSQSMVGAAYRLHTMKEEKQDILLNRYGRRLLVMLAVLVLVNVMVALWIYGTVVPPVARLEKGIGVLATGALDHRVDVETEDEIGRLAQAFNRMAGNLEKVTASRDDLEKEIRYREIAEENLRASQKMLQVVLDTIPVRVFWKDRSSNYLGCNIHFARDAGLNSPEEIIGKDDFQLSWAAQAELYRADDHQVMESGEAKLNYEESIIGPEGKEAWIKASKIPLRDINGDIYAVLGAFEDITDQKRAEDELKDYADTQAELLREVNHRVKNNLAAILSIIQMEKERVAAEGQLSYLPFLHDVLGRIQGLSTIHSLLSASKWQPLPLQQICEEVVETAIESMAIPGIDIDLKVQPCAEKIGSRQAHQLALVLNELATNSVKHGSSVDKPLKLRITIQPEGKNISIRFQDNGPGFPGKFLAGDFSLGHIGFDLIHGITTRSLQGNLQIKNENGAVTILSFENEILPEEYHIKELGHE